MQIDQIPHILEGKYSRKIQRIKREARSELHLNDWGSFQFRFIDFWLNKDRDKIPRIDYTLVNCEEFIEKFESKNIPVVICGAMDEWPAMKTWTITKLSYHYRHEKFKVGEDDDGKAVFMGMKYYMHYALKDPNGAIVDDSPLYIFDAGFGKRKLHHSARRTVVNESNHRYDPKFSQAPCHLVDDFIVPKYFKDDLFQLVGARRPPFRWLVIGPARSGTGIHIDPLGTSAWNSLIKGHKRWVLFPPETLKTVISPKLKDHEASTWFAQVYPKFHEQSKKYPQKTLGEELGMVEILQEAGETVFVPGGWHHIVINLDFAIAITQNFCSKTNLDYVWLKTRFARPKMALKLQMQLTCTPQEVFRNEKTKQKERKRKRLKDIEMDYDKRIKSLAMVPALPTSSSSSGSSSTTCSSSDSDVNIICTCHGILRRKS
jgi:histone arginine demethylase JMJD6